MKVGVIGCGVAGIGVAKVLTERGHSVQVFERNDSFGGVWDTGYVGQKLQAPKELFEYPDFLFPEDADEVPTREQVKAYLQAYVTHFNIGACLHFNQNVNSVAHSRQGDGWELSITDTITKRLYEKKVDFLVICNGLYCTKKMPTFHNQHLFQGRILHTVENNDKDITDKQKVVVLGFGKSALEVATEVSSRAENTTLVYRASHWPIPENIFGIDGKYILLPRSGSWFLPQFYTGAGYLSKLLHSWWPSKWMIAQMWKSFEYVLDKRYSLKALGLLPKHSYSFDIFSNDYVPPEGMYDKVQNQTLKMINSEISEFKKDRVILTNGDEIEADVVIMGTGFKADFSFLPKNVNDAILEDDGAWLYRHMMHPSMPNAAFVGYAACANNVLSDSLESLWLAELLDNRVVLPSDEDMLADIQQLKLWKRQNMPYHKQRGSLLMFRAQSFHDQLLKDMGELPQQKGMNYLSEYFYPYRSRDYKTLFERKRKIHDQHKRKDID